MMPVATYIIFKAFAFLSSLKAYTMRAARPLSKIGMVGGYKWKLSATCPFNKASVAR